MRENEYAKYAKYAGAVSNKSKRNYAELRLARPDNLKEYASENARPRTVPPSGKPQRQASSSGKPQGQASSSGKPQGQARSTGSRPKPTNGGTRRPSSAKSVRSGAAKASATAGRSAGRSGYIDDDYTKALNNSDFYGDLVEKYYIKYPEKQEERRTPAGASTAYTPPKQHRRMIDAAVSDPPANHAAGQSESIAKLAVKNRGTSAKKKYAKVVKTGKAKGSVPIGNVHRRVHRRNRRQSMLIAAAAVTSAALIMVSVIFFVFFKVDKIEVAGETPYSDDRITSLCVFHKGDNIMFIDTASSEQQVINTLPYVESCKITRSIPGSVAVNVTCADTLGVAEYGSGFWSVVSTSGKILENITNVEIVSASDLVMSVSYEPGVHTVDELAEVKKLPVLAGLTFDSGKVGTYADVASMENVSGFVTVKQEAEALGMRFSKLKYTDRGYEAEYDGRINIVLGDTNERSILKKRIEIAHYIICVTGDISEHDMGEITYLKNQTFFNPSYDISEEEVEKYARQHASEPDDITGFAGALLEKGVSILEDRRDGDGTPVGAEGTPQAT